MDGPQWAPILRMIAGWPCSWLNRPISCNIWSAAATASTGRENAAITASPMVFTIAPACRWATASSKAKCSRTSECSSKLSLWRKSPENGNIRGVSQRLSGNPPLFREIGSTETGCQIGKARCWRAFLLLSESPSSCVGLHGWQCSADRARSPADFPANREFRDFGTLSAGLAARKPACGSGLQSNSICELTGKKLLTNREFPRRNRGMKFCCA